MKIRWRFLMVFLLVAGLVGGALLFPTIALAAIVNPITRGLWLIFRLFRTVDQEIYWGLLAIVVFGFSLLLLPRGPEKPGAPAAPAPPRPKDAVAEWAYLLENAAQSGENRKALQYRLNSLNQKIAELTANGGVDEFSLRADRGQRWQLKRWSGRLRPVWPAGKAGRRCEYADRIDPFLNELETLMEVRDDGDSNESHEHR